MDKLAILRCLLLHFTTCKFNLKTIHMGNSEVAGGAGGKTAHLFFYFDSTYT